MLPAAAAVFAAEADSPAEKADSPDAEAPAGQNTEKKKEEPGVKVYYRDGLHISSEDGNYTALINWRAQMRYTDVVSPELVGEDEGIGEASGFLVRRARFKMKGNVYKPWIKYYLEYGIKASTLLTWQFDFQKNEKAGARIGQYKVIYNRERVDSSGKQQFAERSIVNRLFTVDRQSGVTGLGHLFKGTRMDSKWAVGVFTGTGRGGPLDDDRRPMYSGRWQWNFLKRDLPFSQSDIKRRDKAAASLAFAASTNVSRFTRFSSGGGGQLPGFDSGEAEQYKLEQWMAEYAHHYKGLSLQGEYHFKRIEDRVNDQVTELDGYYAQAGYFFHSLFESFPKAMELAVRTAVVDSRMGVEIPAGRETTVAMNWFYRGHKNKLTADVSQLKNENNLGTEDRGWRARLQWDITF